MSTARRILVVGGGLTGWSTAAALKRRVPLLDVAILPLAPPADALSDRIATTLPSIFGFHADLGIGLDDSVLRTGSSYRLGTLFRDWSAGTAYMHAYGRHGAPLANAPFHQFWIRAALAGATAPFDAFSPAAVMAQSNRFVLPAGDGLLSAYSVGLSLNLPRYAAMLTAFASHVGVRVCNGALAGLERDADGGVAALIMDDGSQLRADLYCDCTGPAARLHGALGVPREDWRRWLPCDRLILADHAPVADTMVVEQAIATERGWEWIGPMQRGAVYRHADGDPSTDAIPFHAGATTEPWRHNVIAIGDSAVMIEPLEWSNLHLAHSAIDRMIAMLPAGRPHPLECAEYNRQTLAEAHRVRDFVLLHYVTAQRNDRFWRDMAQLDLPQSLAHTLRLFRERGRLPFYEEETFDRDSWLAVLLGQGVLPRRVDPLADSLSPEAAARAMRDLQAAIAQAILPLPTPAAFRAAQSRHLYERA